MTSPEMQREWICPITMEIMTDPVMLSDGHSYERAAIEHWLSTNDRSPLTRERLTSTALVTNHNLKRTIETFRQQQQQQQQSDAAPANTQHRSIPPLGISIQPVLSTVSDVAGHLSFKVPSFPSLPLMLICVIDISGSMNCRSQESTGNAEDASAFSRLDLVRHSLHTTIELLRPCDSFSIIAFSDSAKCVLPLTAMDLPGKQQAKTATNNLIAGGGTNLWKGIELAISQVHNLPLSNDANIAIVLQTDGEPSAEYNPPRGIVPSLQVLLQKKPQNFTISTCGYGYGAALDTPLLRNIAQLGKGSFVYIPDGSMVGTVFIHLMCNLLSVIATQVVIKFGTERTIEVGPIRSNQTYNFFFHPVVTEPSITNLPIIKSAQGSIGYTMTMLPPQTLEQSVEFVRSKFVYTLADSVELAEYGHLADAIKKMKEFAADRNYFSLLLCQDNRINAIFNDVNFSASKELGQVDKGFEFWDRWGRHYLPSFLMAHQRQEKINFKDASMQMYSNPELEEQILKAEDVFANLPPPVSSISCAGHGSASTPVSMRSMVTRGNGCFSADTLLLTGVQNVWKRVDEIKPGDVLNLGFVVKCVVKFNGKSEVIRHASSFGISAYHPIRIDNAPWTFPCESLADSKVEHVDHVFNLVLDRGHFVQAQAGIQCVTLGHGLNDNNVVAHEYFGTDRVIKDLQANQGFDRGYVEFNSARFLVQDGRVVRIDGE